MQAQPHSEAPGLGLQPLGPPASRSPGHLALSTAAEGLPSATAHLHSVAWGSQQPRPPSPCGPTGRPAPPTQAPHLLGPSLRLVPAP